MQRAIIQFGRVRGACEGVGKEVEHDGGLFLPAMTAGWAAPAETLTNAAEKTGTWWHKLWAPLDLTIHPVREGFRAGVRRPVGPRSNQGLPGTQDIVKDSQQILVCHDLLSSHFWVLNEKEL